MFNDEGEICVDDLLFCVSHHNLISGVCISPRRTLFLAPSPVNPFILFIIIIKHTQNRIMFLSKKKRREEKNLFCVQLFLCLSSCTNTGSHINELKHTHFMSGKVKGSSVLGIYLANKYKIDLCECVCAY